MDKLQQRIVIKVLLQIMDSSVDNFKVIKFSLTKVTVTNNSYLFSEDNAPSLESDNECLFDQSAVLQEQVAHFVVEINYSLFLSTV